MAKAMDDAARWLEEIKGDIEQISQALDLAFQRGDWPEVAKARTALSKVMNRLGNLRTLAQPDNWRMLADRNGVHLPDEEE